MRSALAKPAKSSWSCFEKNSIFKKKIYKLGQRTYVLPWLFSWL